MCGPHPWCLQELHVSISSWSGSTSARSTVRHRAQRYGGSSCAIGSSCSPHVADLKPCYHFPTQSRAPMYQTTTPGAEWLLIGICTLPTPQQQYQGDLRSLYCRFPSSGQSGTESVLAQDITRANNVHVRNSFI
jgi:hypothetical protein